jgi:hypothetical protein
MTLPEALAEIERLRADLKWATSRVLKLEVAAFRRDVEAAFALGTIEAPAEPEQPWTVTHDVPGNAPV